jgi:hypothetical protein
MRSLIQSLLRRGQFPRRAYISPISTFRSFTMSTTGASSSNQSSDLSASSTTASTSTSTYNPSPQEKEKELLALPASSNDPKTTELDMSTGEAAVKLDHLGPMVVNVDGTLSRISNWEGMADIEKKNTLRIIAKRNQARLEALKRGREEEG